MDIYVDKAIHNWVIYFLTCAIYFQQTFLFTKLKRNIETTMETVKVACLVTQHFFFSLGQI